MTLNRVMEIARLEVSTQQHLDRMQETAKVNYVQYGRSTKLKKKKPQSSAGATSQGAGGHKGAGGHRGSSGKSNKRPPLHLTPATDVGRGNIARHRTARLWMLLAEGVAKRHITKRFAYRKHSAHSLETPQTTSAGAAASEPLYFNDEGQPVYTYMVSVPHANKHLIRFPITIEPMTLRRKGTHMNSSLSTPSVLLKADTGADVNLINRKTFDQLFDSKVLKPTPIRMENYGNSTVKVLGMFHAFLRWKERVYKQLFYVTDCDRSPNLLSRDACYTLGVLKPCYTVERAPSAQ